MPDPKRIYESLLKLYPAHFREEYETPLQRQFLDEYRDIHGTRARVMFWGRALTDLAISIPAETLRELRQDLVHAIRVYRRHPMSVVLAVAALALAIGAATGVFSVVNALLLRSLPFHAPERLVQLQNFPMPSGGAAGFYAWRNRSAYLQDAALYWTEPMNLSTTREARRITVAETSASFFKLLGSEPEIGRSFAPGEDMDGHDNVAIIGYALWQQFFGGDPGTLGSTIRLNGIPLTVVGIAPPRLDYPGQAAVWTPAVFNLGRLSRSRAIMWTAIGRLKPGLTLPRTEAMYRADVVAAAKYPLDQEGRNRLRLISLRDLLAGDVRQASLVLLVMVIFVLLTACANVAHLLLSRVNERRHEMMLRAALGASRARLLQQLTTESTVLTLCAAACGLVVAYWVSRLASLIQPAGLAGQNYTILDWPVLTFAIALAAITGFIFGVLPANLISRMHLQTGSRNKSLSRMRRLLIAMQTTFTLLLIAGALTMGRSFMRLAGTDLGLHPEHVVTMSVALSGTAHEDHAGAYYAAALERLRAVPGVESAAAVEYLPLGPNSFALFNFTNEGRPDRHPGVLVTATRDYLRTMGTAILRGRDFTSSEEQGSESVAVVNEIFARQFDATLNVVGKKVRLDFRKTSMTIVGVARTQRYGGPALSDADSGMPQVFVLPGSNRVPNMTFVAKVRGRTEAHLPICRDAIRSVDPKVPVFNVQTLEQRLNESLAGPRFYTTVVLSLGVFALLLAVIGIYGVASFSVAQRTQEIGVRLAVGATPERLRGMLLRESLLPVAAGMTLGVAAVPVLGSLVVHLIAGADPIGAGTCALAAAMLLATAAIAVRMATRRILQLDPARALNTE